jgi:hypothetical protein
MIDHATSWNRLRYTLWAPFNVLRLLRGVGAPVAEPGG